MDEGAPKKEGSKKTDSLREDMRKYYESIPPIPKLEKELDKIYNRIKSVLHDDKLTPDEKQGILWEEGIAQDFENLISLMGHRIVRDKK